ncbi:twin-arginine translocase subunit TatC [Cryptosporangium aurantiacum]|uniref:Sec-independent protein translocase protein TatC n=1 Tax=Cryptosporangium aurantiacum TaxID=134849 RepID=A0A1M7RIE3_9ACTN|nr:twin-arginine translocase subunit TatC [Cryptosporangium aurantiacum]SHN46063.1 sec-independent protein translocase protein TatC [Cryptosporangium aurantiacum]
MTLMEHIRELRDRLFKAVVGIVLGLCIGLYFSLPVQRFLTEPYCSRFADGECALNATTPLEPTIVRLKIALYLGLIIASPIWLFQLWAFVAPGLHARERKWSYAFISFAVPLFVAGAVLAHFVVAKGIEFLLPVDGEYQFTTNIAGYIDFVTGMLMIFGVGFEFPLLVFMLNLAGVASAKRLLGWWRAAVFLTFVFTALVTPTPDPFGMTALGLAMSALYFAAVGAAFLNERRRAKVAARNQFAGLDDDEASQIEPVLEPVETSGPVQASETPEPSRRDDVD